MSRDHQYLGSADSIAEWALSEGVVDVEHVETDDMVSPDFDSLDETERDREIYNLATDYVELARAITTARREGRGRMEIHRAIVVTAVGKVEWDNLGACWSFREDGAIPVFGHKGNQGIPTHYVRIHGVIDMDDVDWWETVKLNHVYHGEDEIRVEPGAVIDVTGISTRTRGHAWIRRPFKRVLRAEVHEDSRDAWRSKR